MNKDLLVSSWTLAIGLALGSLIYDFFAHRDELSESFPFKYLLMFVICFVLALIWKSIVSAVKAKRSTADSTDS